MPNNRFSPAEFGLGVTRQPEHRPAGVGGVDAVHVVMTARRAMLAAHIPKRGRPTRSIFSHPTRDGNTVAATGLREVGRLRWMVSRWTGEPPAARARAPGRLPPTRPPADRGSIGESEGPERVGTRSPGCPGGR